MNKVMVTYQGVGTDELIYIMGSLCSNVESATRAAIILTERVDAFNVFDATAITKYITEHVTDVALSITGVLTVTVMFNQNNQIGFNLKTDRLPYSDYYAQFWFELTNG